MSDAEWKQFLAKLYGGNANQLAGGIMQGLEPATPQPVPQGVMGTDSHELNHHTGAGVKTYNASGTNPMMMAGTSAVGAGLNDVAQPVMNSIGFPDRNAYQMDATQELVNSMTDDEHNVYMQLEEFQRPAFLQAIQENKISQYEAENFNRLRMPY